ncbi:hypothetical protein ACAE110713_29715 [Achromobacter aegrifaciens]
MYLLGSSEHAARHAYRDSGLLELVVFVLTGFTHAGNDRHIAAADRDIAVLRQYVAGEDPHVAPGVHGQIAAHAADSAAGVASAFALHPVGSLLLAIADAEAAATAKARLGHLLVLVVLVRLGRCGNVDVPIRHQRDVVVADDIRPHHIQIPPRHQHRRVAGKGRPLGLFPVAGGDGVRGLGRQEALGLVADLVVGRAGFYASDQIDVASRAHRQLLAGGDFGRTRVDVLPRDQREVAARRDGRADFGAGAQVVAVILVQDQRFAVALRKRFQRDIAPGLQTCVVLDRDLRRGQRDIAASLHVEVAGVDAGHAADVRAPGAAEVLGGRGGCQGDVSSCLQGDVVALDQRHQVGQVLARGEVDGGALDQAAALVDDVAGGHDGGFARADGAAVDDVAFGFQLDVAAGHEGAVALQVAFAHQQVDLRDQHGLGGAVGQRDGLFDQPDQVGGQLALLRLGQRDTELDAVVAGELRASGEQGLVLAVVVAVLVEEALAGGGQDLVGHELLFIETVAQALGLARGRQELGACGYQGIPAAQARAGQVLAVDRGGGAAGRERAARAERGADGSGCALRVQALAIQAAAGADGGAGLARIRN